MNATGSYSFGQLEQLWIDAGGPQAVAPIMAAIAKAESGGDPTEYNLTDNGGTQSSWGLWQISDGTHNVLANWANPATNAEYAVQKYYSQGLGAWGTYTSGAYKQFLTGAGDVIGSVTGAAAGGGGGGGAEAWGMTVQRWAVLIVVLVLLVLILGTFSANSATAGIAGKAGGAFGNGSGGGTKNVTVKVKAAPVREAETVAKAAAV